MDSDDVAGMVIAVLVVVLVFVGLFALIGVRKEAVDKECKSSYGQTWVGKTPAYSPDMCVNNDGSVKYLQ